MEEKKKNNKIVINIFVFIFGILLVLVGYFIYQKISINNEEDIADDFKYVLDVYQYENGGLCLTISEECVDSAFVIPTISKNAKVIAFDKTDTYVLYEDNNKLRLYNVNASESQEIELEDGYKEFAIGKYGLNDNNLYVVENNTIKKYNIDGNLISTSKSYNDLKGIINNYVVYLNNNILMLENIDTEESIEISSWSTNYNYNSNLSGYYSKEKLNSTEEDIKPEGIYIVINYNAQDDNGNYGIEYCYTNDKEIKSFDIKTQN